MRGFFIGLMIFGLLAGISARLLAFNTHSHFHAASMEDSCCHDHDHHGPSPEPHSHDGKDCPPDHHHHGCCCVAMPLTLENAHACRLGISGMSVFGMLHEGEVPPEEPLLSSEKPPLI
jgi:hypothetical protein